MTRFARAKGSKASNERLPEQSTPWKVMKNELQKKQKENEDSKKREKMNEVRQKSYDDFIEKSESEVKREWTEFPEDANPNKNLKNKSPMKKTKNSLKRMNAMLKPDAKIDCKVETLKDEIEHVLVKQGVKRSRDSVTQDCDDGQPEETSSKIMPSKVVVKKQKNKKQIFKINFPKDLGQQNGEENEVDEKGQQENITDKSPKMKKNNKNTPQKGQNQNGNSQNTPRKGQNQNVNNKNAPQKGQNKNGNIKNTSKKEQNQVGNNKNTPGKGQNQNGSNKNIHQKGQNQVDNIHKKEQNQNTPQNKKGQNQAGRNKNTPQKGQNHVGNNGSGDISPTGQKRKAPKVRDDKEHKRRKPLNKTETIRVNDVEENIVRLNGYPITESDAKRLEQLRKQMITKGIPKSQVERALKLERRKAEKALSRRRKMECFNCRMPGHLLAECPKLSENVLQTVTSGICFKCGSTEHSHLHCKVNKTDDYKFASCFICKQQGHISRQCPDNPRGLYPNGGGCNLCGDVTHFKKDCPKEIQEKEKDMMFLNTISSGNIDSLDDDPKKPAAKHIPVKQKVVKF